MTETSNNSHFIENMEEYIHQIKSLLENMAYSSNSATQQELASQVHGTMDSASGHQRHPSELRHKIDRLHPSDLACILEALPPPQRKFVWESIKPENKGKIMIAASGAIRESLIGGMSRDALLDAVEQLDSNDIADLLANFPQPVIRDIFKSRTIEEREKLRTAMSFTADTVGALMDFDVVTIRKDATVESVLRYLRRLDGLPDLTDQLFVVDRDHNFKGVLPLNMLLVNEPEIKISSLIIFDGITLHPDDKTRQIAHIFERYGLVSVPVLDEDKKLLGRLSVQTIEHYIRAKAERNLLGLSGLIEEEDLYASIWKSAKNRWLWISLNLCFAFFASRVIGGFEDTIEKFVALAALMPIIAIVAANSGNQTAAILGRSLALGQINEGNIRRLFIKELSMSLLNGIVWGAIAGSFAYLLYKREYLGLVTAAAMLLSLLLGALAALLIPLTLHKLGRDPIIGSSVLLAAFTTSASFFIFLGLATIFQVN
jgi:magnesium transporter